MPTFRRRPQRITISARHRAPSEPSPAARRHGVANQDILHAMPMREKYARLLARAEADGTTPSELIREALRRYLEAA